MHAAEKPMATSTVQNAIKYGAAKSGIKKRITIHTLRHCYATHLLEDGISLRHISAYLGHAILDQTVKRYVALGPAESGDVPDIPYPALRVSAAHQAEAIGKLGLETSRPVVAFMPGAEYGPAKCWPIEHFTDLARLLDEEGFAVWVLGSEKDRPSGESIASGSSAINVCGRTTLEDVIDLLGYADQAVSNDSGLMHVAAAVGTFVHAIYGSSSPRFTPPLTDRRHVYWLELECSPCFERTCPLGHLRCLKDIRPDDVRSEITALKESR